MGLGVSLRAGQVSTEGLFSSLIAMKRCSIFYRKVIKTKQRIAANERGKSFRREVKSFQFRVNTLFCPAEKPGFSKHSHFARMILWFS